MTQVELEDVSFVLFVSLLHAFILAINARLVGIARGKYGIEPPKMEGPAEFIRIVRAQANDLEFGISFQMGLWTCGLTVHQGIAAVLGIIFIIARYRYRVGYVQDAAKRLPGFRVSIVTLSILYVFCCLGLINLWLNLFAGVNPLALLGENIMGIFKKGE